MDGSFISCTADCLGNDVGDEKRTVGGASGLGCKYKQILNVWLSENGFSYFFFYLWSGDGIEWQCFNTDILIAHDLTREHGELLCSWLTIWRRSIRLISIQGVTSSIQMRIRKERVISIWLRGFTMLRYVVGQDARIQQTVCGLGRSPSIWSR